MTKPDRKKENNPHSFKRAYVTLAKGLGKEPSLQNTSGWGGCSDLGGVSFQRTGTSAIAAVKN